MQQEVLAIAIVRPLEGKREDVVQVLQVLATIVRKNGYARDVLFEDDTENRLFNFRYWVSEEARREAQEDPELQRCWAQLASICTVDHVYERLHKIEAGEQTASPACPQP